MTTNFLDKVKKTAIRFNMLRPGETIIVSVSGGPDSMALLYALSELKRIFSLSLIVAHVNHGLRGKESERDARFVAQEARRLGFPFVVEKVSLKKASGESLQELARKVRYEVLNRIALKYRASRIATGHTADDQAETVLMRFLRGSGRKGLGGIPPVRDRKFIRPLIEITREEIMEYLGEKKVRWILDSSNLKTVYLRNKLRKELIPALKRFNPNIISHLASISSDYRDDDSFLNTLAMKLWKKVADVSRNGITMNIPLLLSTPPSIQKRLIMRSIKEILGSTRGYSHSHYEMILEAARSRSPNLELILPRDLRAERQYTKLLLGKGVARGKSLRRAPTFQIPLRIPGITRIEGLGIKVRARIIREGIGLSRLRKTPLEQAYFDQKDIILPLVLRGFRPGDRFQPFGLKGEKKVKDLFIEKKIPRSLRANVPILDSRGGILWVLGLRQAEKGRVRKGTRKVLHLEILKEGRISA